MELLNLLTFPCLGTNFPVMQGEIPRKQLLDPGPTVQATGSVNSHNFHITGRALSQDIPGLSRTSWSLKFYVAEQRVGLGSTAKMRAKAST